jgi:hypothetical protein
VKLGQAAGGDASIRIAMSQQADPPLCPTCGQPATEALAGPEHGWECRNEACPEFGQAVDADEPPPREDA